MTGVQTCALPISEGRASQGQALLLASRLLARGGDEGWEELAEEQLCGAPWPLSGPGRPPPDQLGQEERAQRSEGVETAAARAEVAPQE